jgi:hypothetical protein
MYSTPIIYDHIFHIAYEDKVFYIDIVVGSKVRFNIDVSVIGVGGEKVLCASWD